MGRHEEFIYSNKYSPEQIAKTIIGESKPNDIFDNSIDIICKATTIRNIDVREINVLGNIEDIKAIKIGKDISGLVVSCPNFSSAINWLPLHMKIRTHSVRPETILWNANKKAEGLTYYDYFANSSIEVNGEIYFAEIKDSSKKAKGSSINEQMKKAKKEKEEKKEVKSITKDRNNVER